MLMLMCFLDPLERFRAMGLKGTSHSSQGADVGGLKSTRLTGDLVYTYGKVRTHISRK